MIVQVKRGDEVISTSDSNSDTIVKPHMRKVKKNRFNKKEFDVVITNYRPQGQVTIKEEEAEQKVEDNSKVIEISLDTSEPSKVEELGFKTIITGGKPIKNDRDLNVKVVKGNVNQNKKTEVKEKKEPVIPMSMMAPKDKVKKEEPKEEEPQEVTPSMIIDPNKQKMVLTNTKIKLSAADMIINDKICSGEYYFDENGVLRKGDGSVYGGKKLRLKASDYTAAEDFPTKIDDEDY